MRPLPVSLSSIGVPPLKCQGIKTKLVRLILKQICWDANGYWIEPFLGSGVVAFNLAPERAILADTNRHIIRFYQAIQQGEIDRAIVHAYLTEQGQQLATHGADYYYKVRSRFNETAEPLDFLFLNRSCFNGLVRFNRQGNFNVPFCQKPQRFSRSYITKISNQVGWVTQQMLGKDWTFRVAFWSDSLQVARSPDFVYLDPPYIGRHTDYYNAWDGVEATKLAMIAQQLPCGFAVSMWLKNQHRCNQHIQDCWSDLDLRQFQHFYHIGSKEAWRGAIVEALLIKPGFATEDDAIAPVSQ